MEKFKLWWAKTNISNIGWLAGFVGSMIAQWWFVAGACLGIFVYINFNVITKLLDEITTKEPNAE